MKVDVRARVRRLIEGIDAGGSGDDEALVLSPQLEVLVAQGAAPAREVVRAGRSFYVANAAAVAAVVAIPSTACALALYNGEPDGGRSYVIDWVSATNAATTSGAAGEAQLLFNVGQVREAVPTDAALAIKKCNGLGGSGNDTRARTIIGGTSLPATTGVAGQWFPFGPSGVKLNVVAATTDVGYGMFADVGGRFICSPGRYFAVHAQAAAVGETFICSIGWHEVQTQLG